MAEGMTFLSSQKSLMLCALHDMQQTTQ